jgi:GINS complex subunit 3
MRTRGLVKDLLTDRLHFLLPLNALDRSQLGTSRLVSLDLPSALSERVMNALKADPRTVDLRALAPHFYSLGVRVLDLFEEDELVTILTEV